MTKEQRSAQDIQAEVSRRLHRRPAVRAAGAHIEVPVPEPRRVDGTGLNWWMSGFGQAIGFEEDIRLVVSEVTKMWNLAA
jgi:hypothetical protein